MIHGNQIGADLLAGQWAKSKGLKVAWYRADWHGYGKAAGGLKTGISSCFKTSRVIGRPYSGHISDIRRRNNNVPNRLHGCRLFRAEAQPVARAHQRSVRPNPEGESTRALLRNESMQRKVCTAGRSPTVSGRAAEVA